MSVGILSNPYGAPGISASATSDERRVWWGHENLRVWASMPQIVSTTVDSGNTPTTSLRAGLVLGRVDSSGLWTHYDPTATDGSEVARGVLAVPISTVGSPSGSAENKVAPILIGGLLKSAELIGLDALARIQLSGSGRFAFDDAPASAIFGPSGYGWGGPMLRFVNKSANYTVVAADNFTFFTASGAAAFTLPALARGLCFEFLNIADNTVSVASAAGNDIIWDGDAEVSSLAASTSSHKIGFHIQVFSNKAGTAWYVRNFSPAGVTITAT